MKPSPFGFAGERRNPRTAGTSESSENAAALCIINQKRITLLLFLLASTFGAWTFILPHRVQPHEVGRARRQSRPGHEPEHVALSNNSLRQQFFLGCPHHILRGVPLGLVNRLYAPEGVHPIAYLKIAAEGINASLGTVLG